MLWNEYCKFRNEYVEKLDVGIIIGNIEDDYNPYMMITNFNKLKNRWGQKWWKI